MAVLVALVLSRTTAGGPARLVVALAVMTGAAVAPLVAAAGDRGSGEGGVTAQSEVLILEEAATSLLDGRNPYAEAFDRGPLADRPAPTRTHLPYPPGMMLFGIPKALAGEGPLTDARVWFLVASAAVGIPAIRRMRVDTDGRLLVFQVLFVLPTGAMLLATGGHDVPVLATLLAAFVLVDSGRPVAAGVAGGAALAMRQTSVLVIPFLLAVASPRPRSRALAAAILLPLALASPFLVWDQSAFVEDVVRFPLGLGAAPSSARTPTLGSILIDVAPGARTAVTVALVVAIVGAVVTLVAIRPPRTAAGGAARAAAAYAVAIALAPAARFGYVVYPLSLLAWAVALRRTSPGAPEEAGP